MSTVESPETPSANEKTPQPENSETPASSVETKVETNEDQIPVDSSQHTATNNSSNSSSDFASKISSFLPNIDNALSYIDTVYRSTKQTVMEKMGKVKVTEDPEIQAKIDRLNELQTQYEELIKLGTKFHNQFAGLNDTMNQLGTQMAAMAVKDKGAPSLLMSQIADSYRNISRNGTAYSPSVKAFYDNVAHFSDKVINDTIETAKKFEKARFEYDLVQTKINQAQHLKPNVPVPESLAKENQAVKERYDQIKSDLETKIETLHMKRTKDMEVQLEAYLKNLNAFYSNSLFVVNKITSGIPKSESGSNLSLSHSDETPVSNPQ